MNRNCRALLLLVAMGSGSAPAQEIAVSDPVLVPLSTSAADHPARILEKSSPAYPARWRKSLLPHWMSVGLLLDKKGSVLHWDIDCEKGMYKNLEEAVRHWRYAPGTYRGKPVPSACRFTLLFNPAREDRSSSDSAARIVAGPFTPRLPEMSGFAGSLQFNLQVAVDENGRARVLKMEPLAERYARSSPDVRAAYDAPEVVAALRTTVERWTFAPALKAGKPVAAELPLFAAATNDNSLDTTEPKPIKQVQPVYPYSLRKSGNRGEVLVDFYVDAKGSVHNPTVLQSTHPDFEAPAVAAVLQWKFEPGTMGGKPIDRHMRCPIDFVLNGDSFGFGALSDLSPDGGVEAYSVDTSRKQPPAFQFDTAPKAKLTVLPVYPWEFLKQGKAGKATIRVLIGRQGAALETKVMKASDPEFGQAAAAAALCWTFEPALKAGQPVETVLDHEFVFDETDRDSALDDDADAFLSRIKRHPERIARLGDLDSIPKVRYRTLPLFPPNAPTGSVLVEFYIDRTGKVCFPHALQSTDAALVYPALTSAARWQFDPPQKNGKAVEAVAQIPIVWTAKKAGAAH